jgi:hypothetical protein
MWNINDVAFTPGFGVVRIIALDNGSALARILDGRLVGKVVRCDLGRLSEVTSPLAPRP